EGLLDDLFGFELRQSEALGYLLDDLFLGHGSLLLENAPVGPARPSWSDSTVKMATGSVKPKGCLPSQVPGPAAASTLTPPGRRVTSPLFDRDATTGFPRFPTGACSWDAAPSGPQSCWPCWPPARPGARPSPNWPATAPPCTRSPSGPTAGRWPR